ncbi:MAG: 2Fe-2S iron-sulfur cluster binding domain-containing protein, partial [Fuerstiella sp.]|nr:2Fe-2S iron-sulfur cluster binding domain-containing protein [Fuerstiella sp.]
KVTRELPCSIVTVKSEHAIQLRLDEEHTDVEACLKQGQEFLEQGFPEEARHLEYFSVPELPEYENHEFTLKLARSGKELTVPADKAATDVLTENGIHIDIKCADGICGVCKCGLVSGEVEHRDFVLSQKQREDAIILCQSRAAEPGGTVEIDI